MTKNQSWISGALAGIVIATLGGFGFNALVSGQVTHPQNEIWRHVFENVGDDTVGPISSPGFGADINIFGNFGTGSCTMQTSADDKVTWKDSSVGELVAVVSDTGFVFSTLSYGHHRWVCSGGVTNITIWVQYNGHGFGPAAPP